MTPNQLVKYERLGRQVTALARVLSELRKQRDEMTRQARKQRVRKEGKER